MKKEIADRWVAELRSGKWKQGTGFLEMAGHFCCLGVLCKMAEAEGVVQSDRRFIGSFVKYGSDKEYHKVLPIEVRHWSGVKTPIGQYDDGKGMTYLTTKNDSGATFSEIADIIEKHWEEL